jgi:type II secretory pathway pseudopilin PulG
MLNIKYSTTAHKCMHDMRKEAAGFTLIELSVVFIIISVIIGGGFSLLVTGIWSAQYNSTVNTMDAIEDALQKYVAANGRIPCPADLTIAKGAANYGQEAGYAVGGTGTGECVTGMTPAANTTFSNGAEEGGVPTRTLSLPDSYMYDGWGHKFRYVVNPAYTISNSSHSSWVIPTYFGCTNVSIKGITVNDASGNPRTQKAIYAIISHGPNGHGGYTSNGIVTNTGSTNADEQQNCHCTNTGAGNGNTAATYVEKAPMPNSANLLNSFDDIVAYKEDWQLQTANNQYTTSSCPATCTPVSGYSYCRSIIIDHTKVGTVSNTDQANFPMLFSGTYSYLATVANGGNVQNASGYDIVFTSDSAGNTTIPFERESYIATTGVVVFWVQVPLVSHSADTSIYMSYGNASINTDHSQATLVWDSNYKAVYHLNSSLNDSTSNANTMSNDSSTSTAGVFANGRSFTSSDPDDTKTITLPTTAVDNFTMSAWAQTSVLADDAAIIYLGDDSASSNGYGIYENTYWSAFYDSASGGTVLPPSPPVTNKAVKNTWTYLVLTRTSGVGQLYINGVAAGNTFNNTPVTPVKYFSLGSEMQSNGTQSKSLDGKIDEARFSVIPRSADWIITEFNNQGWPDKASGSGLGGTTSGFYTVGGASTR